MVVCCCSTITNSIHRVRQVNIHHHYHSLAPSRLPTRPPRPAWREPVRFSLVLAACAQPPHALHPLQPPPPPARRLRWPHRPTTPSQQSPDPVGMITEGAFLVILVEILSGGWVVVFYRSKGCCFTSLTVSTLKTRLIPTIIHLLIIALRPALTRVLCASSSCWPPCVPPSP